MTPRTMAICTLALLAAVSLTHLPACLGFFVSDDFVYIENTHEQPLTKFLNGSDRAGFPQYQPLTLASFTLCFRWFALAAQGYHAVNLVALLIAAVALLLLARRLIGSWRGALATAALFGLHPAGAASVGFISDRGRLFSATLTLSALALLAWAPWLRRRSLAGGLVLAAAGTLAAAKAVFCFPDALWLIPMLPLLMLLLPGDDAPAVPAAVRLLWIAPAIALLIALGFGLGALVQGPAGLHDLRWTPGLYLLRNLARGLQLVLLPLELDSALRFAMDWQYLLFPLALLAAAAGCWLAGRWVGHRPLLAAAGLALLGYAPNLCEEPRLGLLLIPAAGACLAAGALFERSRSLERLRGPALAALVVLLLALGLGSLAESLGWRAAGTLARSATLSVIHGSGSAEQPRQAYIVVAPDSLGGRYVLRNGAFQACRLFHGPRNLYVERWLGVGLGPDGRGAVRVERPLPTRFVVSIEPPARFLLLPDGSRAHRAGEIVQQGGLTYQVLELGRPFCPTKIQIDVPQEWLLEQTPDLYLFSDGRITRYDSEP